MMMDRIEVITSVERRRRWSRAEKERLVASMMEPDANASEIARKAGIHTSQLFRWRRVLANGSRGVSFVPLAVSATHGPAPPATISIEFAVGVRVRIEGTPDPTTLSNVIGSLMASERRR